MFRRVLNAFVVLSVGAAALTLPASHAAAIDPPTVRVTPGVSSVLVGETRQLTATVANLTNTAVTWSVRAGAGTVSATGLYTPPAQAPATPVAVVRAASVEDPSVFGDATVAIASGVAGGAFGAELPSMAGGGGQDADMGDINGDGRTDVVLFQNCCNGLSVGHLVTLTWNGTSLVRGGPTAAVSTYQENGTTATSDHLLDIELGDLDGDGDLDVYVPFGSTQAQYWRYQVWRNNGTGTFAPDARVRTTGGARSGARARVTDFDGDGKLDAVRMEWYGTMLFEKGNGDGTFQEPVQLMHTTDADSFDVGDLTGDGRPEIAVGIKGTSNSSTTIEVGINSGFGGIASETTYNVGMAPEPRIADADGDGWNDLVVGVGGEQYTFFPPRLLALTNLATGTGAVSSTPVQLLSWRPRALEAVHADADGVLDLAGFTYRGPVLLRRTAPNTYAATHALSRSIHHATFGDVTGDGRVDVFTNFDNASQFWPGSADPTLTFAVDPTVTRVNATLTAEFTATLRNTTVEPKVTWSASRGTFGGQSGTTYTAPATAAPSGTPVTVTAALTGTTTTATRAITVVNDKFQFTSLGGLQVRHVVADPQQPTHLYAATSNGVYRSVSNGVSFSPLGTLSMTGPDARQVAVLRDPGGVLRVLAIFGTTVYRINVDSSDWMSAGAPPNATAVSVAPNTPVVWLAASGQVARSADGGMSWTGLGQTSVTGVTAIDASNVWIVRSAAPRVSRGAFVTSPAAALEVTARELPVPNAAVNALAVHPTNRALAYVATNDAANPLFRDTAAEGLTAWAAVATPGVVDRLSVSGSGVVLAARAGSLDLYKSTDEGAAWHSVNRGFTSVTAQSVAHRGDGLDLVGTTNGLYTPVETVPPAAPAVTGGPTGTTGPGTTNSFSFTFDAVADAASYLCALDDKAWAACTSPKAYSGPLATGTHTFSVVAVDASGNESAPGTRSWTVDATPPPVPTILTGPSGTVSTTTAAFTFELTGDAAGATCSLDNATPTACASGVSYSSLAQGAHTFAVRSVDAAGNASAPTTRSWSVDSVPPAFPHFYQSPGWVSQYPTAFFQWQSEAGATYACTLDGTAVACSASSASLSNLTEGAHTFRVTATDAAANSIWNQHDWTVDLTDPGAPVISVQPDASTTATTAHFAFASPSSDVSYYWCVLDGATQSCYGTADYASLGYGNHTFSVRAVDQAGRQSTATSYSWTVALPPPVISGGPTGLVNTRTASFTFTAPDGATTACSLDGGTPAPCTSGVTYEALADGPHTFAVTATKSGATSAAATRSWTVDATAPAAPELTAVPPLRTTSGVASFAWTADPALTYSCALDGAAVTCGSGSYQQSGLAQGAHQFVLTARDAALNAATASYSWTVDQTGPTVSVSTKPPARTTQSSATFEFGSAAADLQRYVCTVDGVANACTSPLLLSSLGQGAHTFSVQAFDDLGNGGNTVTHSWTVDSTGPAVTLTGKPPARTTLTTATFAFSSGAADLAGYVCTVDGVTNPCASPLELSALTVGTHTFSVVAKDDLGNVGAPATHQWTVDQSGPAVTLTAKPAARTNSSTATFEFSSTATDVASYECTVDRVAAPCTSPLTKTSLAQGTHSFSVVARDDLGNAGAPVTHSWTVDQTAPSVTLTGKPPARTALTSATFTFSSTATDLAGYVCTLDGVSGPCTSPFERTSLPVGSHTFSVVARDDVGNVGSAVTHTWVIDQSGPPVTLDTKPPARTTLTSATFTFSSTDPDVAAYECTVDGVTADCASPLTLSPLSEGAHSFAVAARDELGNTGVPVTHSWTVDRTGPAVTVSAKPAVRTSQTSATFEFASAAADLHHYACTVDGVVTDPCASPLSRTGLAAGEHTFAVTAYDDLGNAGTAVPHTWVVDVSAPDVAISVKPPAWSNDATPAFEFTSAAGDVTGFECTLDGTTTPCASPWTDVPVLAAGPHTLSVVAVDGARNVSATPATYGWTVDLTAPLATVVTPSAVLDPAHAVAFDEPVRGVAGSTVRLLLTGTTTAVPAAVTCRTAAAAAVACTAETVRRAVLLPAAPLTPGQLYTVSASGLTDLAGNAAEAVTVAYRASVSEQESGLASVPVWRKVSSAAAKGGSYHLSDAKGASASYAFTGTSVTLYAVRGPSFGLADLYVDNVLKASKVNLYASSAGSLTKTISGLSNAKHTLKVVVRGERGSTSGTGMAVSVDAVKVGATVTSSPALAFTWGRAGATAASGGAYALEDNAGATFTLRFRGRGVDWVTVTGPAMGKASVTIDGVSKGTFDNWASATKYGVVRRFGGLTDAVHTLKITVLGTRRSGATGTNVAVDRFGILA